MKNRRASGETPAPAHTTPRGATVTAGLALAGPYAPDPRSIACTPWVIIATVTRGVSAVLAPIPPSAYEASAGARARGQCQHRRQQRRDDSETSRFRSLDISVSLSKLERLILERSNLETVTVDHS